MKQITAIIVIGMLAYLTYLNYEKPPLTKAELMGIKAEKSPKRDSPGEAAQWMSQLLETSHPTMSPAQLNQQYSEQLILSEASRGGIALSADFNFEELGPGVFGGRVRAFTTLPSDSDVLLTGGISGGVWKSINGGNSWSPINDFLPNLAVSTLVRDPNNENVVYMGTGEGFFNFDAQRGAGIFVSNNFGDSWSQLASTDNSDFHYVNRMAKLNGQNVLLAATRQGIFRSTNSGTSWTEVSGQSVSSRGFVDLKVDPSDSTHVMAVHYGGSQATRFVMQSTDSGVTWNVLGALDGLPTNNIGRIELGFGSDGVIYAAIANSADATNGLYRSPGLGNNFVKTASNTAFIERQGWYDLVVAVDPSNSDKVIMGAVDQFITTNAGATITKNTFWNPGAGQIPNYVHADQHIYYFDPNDSDTIYVGSDGGIFRSTDGGDTYENINNNFFVSQSYGIAVNPDGSGVTSGTQDNGSQLYFGDDQVWLEWSGGDGGYSAWDQQNSDFLYGSRPSGSMFGSSDGGITSTNISLPDTTGASFIQPFAIDENDGNRLLVGTDNLFFSANIRALGAASFTDVSGPIGTVSATTISSVDGSQAFGGTRTGQLYRIDNLGTTNDSTNISSGLQSGSDVTDIYVDPADLTGETLIVTQADYDSDRLSRSINGGSSWTSISGNLPNIPLLSVTSDPLEPTRFFVGSELGLFVSDDVTVASPVWDRYDFGPAFTRILDLVWNNDNLYIGTHGRGTYKASRNLVGIEIDSVQLITNSCDNDSVLDVGETLGYNIKFSNLGGLDIQSAVVTVSSPASVTIANPIVNLGSISDEVVQPFEVTLDSSATCPGFIDLNVSVVHATGSTMKSLTVKSDGDEVIMNTPFVDGAETTSLMTSELVLGATGWSQTNTQANTGTSSWFTTDEGSYSDKSLMSPWLTSYGSNELSFSLFYDTEGDATQRWDGALLEIRTKESDWEDIGQLSTVSYDGILFTNNTAPARMAWSGIQRSWRDATVDLGTIYQGQEIQFRFRMVSDTNTANEGFWVDDIQMTNVSWVADFVCGSCLDDFIFEDGFE